MNHCKINRNFSVAQMLGSSNIIRPQYSWSTTDASSKPWNNTVNVNIALENKDVVLKTCPVTDDIAGMVSVEMTSLSFFLSLRTTEVRTKT
jgi:hypothetical protein